MKVIDLLNKIANGEEVPEKIKFRNFKMKRTNSDNFKKIYVDEDGMFFPEYYNLYLTEKIEIIEEPKKIEKLDITLETTANGNLHNYLMYEGNKYAVSMPYSILNDKLNEIIDYINSKEEE